MKSEGEKAGTLEALIKGANGWALGRVADDIASRHTGPKFGNRSWESLME